MKSAVEQVKTSDWCKGSPSNRTMTLSTQLRQHRRDKSLNVPERSSQSPNLIEHLWRDLKIAVQQRSPSTLTEIERICRETPQMHLCQACSVKHKKTQGCNRWQRCFNKVLSKGSEHLCKCDISIFNV